MDLSYVSSQPAGREKWSDDLRCVWSEDGGAGVRRLVGQREPVESSLLRDRVAPLDRGFDNVLLSDGVCIGERGLLLLLADKFPLLLSRPRPVQLCVEGGLGGQDGRHSSCEELSSAH